MGLFGAIGKVFKPIAKVASKVVNFVPNLLGKIPVVGGALKFVSSLALGGLVPGLGWTGMLGKMGGLGARLSKTLTHLPGAGKLKSLASWGREHFQAGTSQLGKLPVGTRQAQLSPYQQLASQLLQSTHQGRAERALMAQNYLAPVLWNSLGGR